MMTSKSAMVVTTVSPTRRLLAILTVAFGVAVLLFMVLSLRDARDQSVWSIAYWRWLFAAVAFFMGACYNSVLGAIGKRISRISYVSVSACCSGLTYLFLHYAVANEYSRHSAFSSELVLGYCALAFLAALVGLFLRDLLDALFPSS